MWNDDNKKILADREVMLEALEIDMSRKDDWSDGDFTASVDRKTHFLQYAADTLKFDREFILGAGALEYAADTLKADREVVLEAVKNYSYAIKYADDILKADREVVLEAVKNDGEVLTYLFSQPTDNDDYDDIKSDDDIPF